MVWLKSKAVSNYRGLRPRKTIVLNFNKKLEQINYKDLFNLNILDPTEINNVYSVEYPENPDYYLSIEEYNHRK